MTPRIVVLGAGYTGLAAAKLAAKWTGATVTLVNEHDRFVERVRLHQLATGQTLKDTPITGLLRGTGVTFAHDRATAIDTTAKTVRLGDREIAYDILVYALGSHADLTAVPGAAEHAHTLTTLDQARRLRARITAGATAVTVTGGGLTGIEAATELAETHPGLTVRLVTGGAFGATLSAKGRDHLHRAFDRLGITITDNARVTAVHPDGLDLADGTRIPSDTVVWTTGFGVPGLARDAGITVTSNGRIIVDHTLRSISHPEILGIGDAASIRRPGDGLELRMSCATGIPTAQYAIRALADRLKGKATRPFRYRFFSQCISLGRRDALIQFVHGDDSPREAVLTGRAAIAYKETIVRGARYFQRNPFIPAGA